MKVLIVKTSSMGDIIHALPVLDYLHQVSPGITVDWVVEEQFGELLSGNPLLSNLITVRTRRWRRRPFARQTWREVGAVRRALSAAGYDLVFDIQGNLKSGIIARATGCETRLGFAREHLQESANALFTTRKIPQRRQDDCATGRYLRIVSVPFGRDYTGMRLSSDIQTSEEDELASKALLWNCGNGPVFLCHAGTTWQTKFWSEERWLELGRLLLGAFPGATLLFSWGSPSEREAAARLTSALGGSARLLERYSLKGITAVIKKVDLVIAGDTGLTHLAAAVGTPTVSYYRASDGSVSGPRGEGHVIIQAPMSCSRCQRTACDRDAECRASITAEALLKGVQRIFQAQSGPRSRGGDGA